jgi:hypothetical protein
MVSELFDQATVLRKHEVKYFHCKECVFVQSETPYWLEEAYASAINSADTGILQRNLLHRGITSSIIELLFPKVELMLDYGAGHGIFVRLMRDAGFDFRWYDLHATNDYARGFEHKDGEKYGLATCFEVFEHLSDPIDQLADVMRLSPNVLVSTELLPEPPPKVANWWYYLPSHGQHVSFYTLNALRAVARHFERNLLSRGSIHLFTKEPKSEFLFRLAMNSKVSRALRVFRKRPSLVMRDHERLVKEKS